MNHHFSGDQNILDFSNCPAIILTLNTTGYKLAGFLSRVFKQNLNLTSPSIEFINLQLSSSPAPETESEIKQFYLDFPEPEIIESYIPENNSEFREKLKYLNSEPTIYHWLAAFDQTRQLFTKYISSISDQQSKNIFPSSLPRIIFVMLINGDPSSVLIRKVDSIFNGINRLMFYHFVNSENLSDLKFSNRSSLLRQLLSNSQTSFDNQSRFICWNTTVSDPRGHFNLINYFRLVQSGKSFKEKFIDIKSHNISNPVNSLTTKKIFDLSQRFLNYTIKQKPSNDLNFKPILSNIKFEEIIEDPQQLYESIAESFLIRINHSCSSSLEKLREFISHHRQVIIYDCTLEFEASLKSRFDKSAKILSTTILNDISELIHLPERLQFISEVLNSLSRLRFEFNNDILLPLKSRLKTLQRIPSTSTDFPTSVAEQTGLELKCKFYDLYHSFFLDFQLDTVKKLLNSLDNIKQNLDWFINLINQAKINFEKSEVLADRQFHWHNFPELSAQISGLDRELDFKVHKIFTTLMSGSILNDREIENLYQNFIFQISELIQPLILKYFTTQPLKILDTKDFKYLTQTGNHLFVDPGFDFIKSFIQENSINLDWFDNQNFITAFIPEVCQSPDDSNIFSLLEPKINILKKLNHQLGGLEVYDPE